jgi:tetratricopeptide (TPR) repeat protein
MNSETGDKFAKEGEDSLFRYLKSDTPGIMKINSLQGKELEYADYVGTIEYSIVKYFYDNRKIKDTDAVTALENIKKNYDKNIAFFKLDLEKEIIKSLIEILEEKPITHHEFNLAIDYVREVIDNRAWMEDEQAYLKWATYIMGLFTKEESEEYERSIKEFAAKLGLSSKHADLMLLKEKEDDYFDFLETYGEDEGQIEEKLLAEMEEKFLSMTDSEKLDFLMENGLDFYELVGLYVSVLSERGEFEKLEEFYRKLIEKYDDFIYLDVYMGGAYIEKDPVLAKSYFENALKRLDKLDELSKSTKEVLRANLLDLIQKIK